MTIEYKKLDGTTNIIHGEFSINVNEHSFTLIRRSYGYDEYDFYEDEIKDVIELRIK